MVAGVVEGLEAVVEVAVGAVEVAVGAGVELGDRAAAAAATAAAAAGFVAMAARSSGERAGEVTGVGVGDVTVGFGSPEWSILVTPGLGEIGRIPRFDELAAGL